MADSDREGFIRKYFYDGHSYPIIIGHLHGYTPDMVGQLLMVHECVSDPPSLFCRTNFPSLDIGNPLMSDKYRNQELHICASTCTLKNS